MHTPSATATPPGPMTSIPVAAVAGNAPTVFAGDQALAPVTLADAAAASPERRAADPSQSRSSEPS